VDQTIAGIVDNGDSVWTRSVSKRAFVEDQRDLIGSPHRDATVKSIIVFEHVQLRMHVVAGKRRDLGVHGG